MAIGPPCYAISRPPPPPARHCPSPLKLATEWNPLVTNEIPACPLSAILAVSLDPVSAYWHRSNTLQRTCFSFHPHFSLWLPSNPLLPIFHVVKVAYVTLVISADDCFLDNSIYHIQVPFWSKAESRGHLFQWLIRVYLPFQRPQ